MHSIVPSFSQLAAAVATERPGSDILDQIRTGNLSYAAVALVIGLCILASYVTYRLGRFILKIFCILAGLAAIVAAISWFLLQH